MVLFCCLAILITVSRLVFEFFKKDFADAFREINPKVENDFSWWSYRMGARKNNKGWRIDYVAVSAELKDSIKKARHAHEALHSDHAAVVVEMDI